MHPDSIAWAMAQGAPLTCATCRFFHEGNMYCGKSACGGPGTGRDFPFYDGPIPRERFVDRCLVCGNVPSYLIVGLPTKFSLCTKHRKVFDYVGQDDPDRVKYPVKVVAINESPR